MPGSEESLKFGIVGAVQHPQVNYDSVNYSKAPWALQPTQMISYVSCHDDMCLVDRLKTSIPTLTPEQLVRLDKLAQTVVFTSQGVPFIQAGEEVMRDKKGVHNSSSFNAGSFISPNISRTSGASPDHVHSNVADNNSSHLPPHKYHEKRYISHYHIRFW